MNRLPKALIPETKFIDRTDFITGNYLLHGVVPGSGIDGDSFLGSQLRAKALDFSFSTSTTSTAATIRVSVLILKDPNALPVFQSPLLRYDHRQHTVVHDALFDTTMRKTHRLSIPLSALVRYNLAGTAVTDNNIYIAITSDTSIQMNVASRFYYIDN